MTKKAKKGVLEKMVKKIRRDWSGGLNPLLFLMVEKKKGKRDIWEVQIPPQVFDGDTPIEVRHKLMKVIGQIAGERIRDKKWIRVTSIMFIAEGWVSKIDPKKDKFKFSQQVRVSKRLDKKEVITGILSEGVDNSMLVVINIITDKKGKKKLGKSEIMDSMQQSLLDNLWNGLSEGIIATKS